MSDDLRILLDERQITRVLNQYCRGIDRVDLELVRDCYWPDSTDRHGAFAGSRDQFVTWVEGLLRRQAWTMHHLANITIDVAGDEAQAESYALAFHGGEPENDPRWNFAVGCRYIDRFSRRGGEWRIASRITAIQWSQPWQAEAPAPDEKYGPPVSQRDRTDPVYAWAGRAGAQRA